MDDNLKNYMNAAAAEDLPRIVRSDMTRMTEMLAKYRALAQIAPDEVAEQIHDALTPIANTRQALLHVTAVASGYAVPSLVGPGSTEEVNPMPVARTEPVYEVGPGGSGMTLSGALASAKFVSSSAIAKKGIRAGAVSVDGETATDDTTLDSGQTYEISCGELCAKVKIR